MKNLVTDINMFLNENIFYEMKNRKWINKINKVLSDLEKPRGVIINEEDPYGEENWEIGKGLENCFDLLREILPFTFYKEKSIEVAQLDKLMRDTETDEYGTKTYHFGGGDAEEILNILNQLQDSLKNKSINKIIIRGPNSKCVTWSVE